MGFTAALILGGKITAGRITLMGATPVDDAGHQVPDWADYSYSWTIPATVQPDGISTLDPKQSSIQFQTPQNLAGQSLEFSVSITSPDGKTSYSSTTTIPVAPAPQPDGVFTKALILGWNITAGRITLMGATPVDDAGHQIPEWADYSYSWTIPATVQPDGISTLDPKQSSIQFQTPQNLAGQSLEFSVSITSPDGKTTYSSTKAIPVTN